MTEFCRIFTIPFFVLPLALPFVGEVFLVTIRCVKYFLLVMRMLLHEDNSFLLKNMKCET